MPFDQPHVAAMVGTAATAVAGLYNLLFSAKNNTGFTHMVVGGGGGGPMVQNNALADLDFSVPPDESSKIFSGHDHADRAAAFAAACAIGQESPLACGWLGPKELFILLPAVAVGPFLLISALWVLAGAVGRAVGQMGRSVREYRRGSTAGLSSDEREEREDPVGRTSTTSTLLTEPSPGRAGDDLDKKRFG